MYIYKKVFVVIDLGTTGLNNVEFVFYCRASQSLEYGNVYYKTPRKNDSVMHFPNISDYDSCPVVHSHMTSILRTTSGIG